MGSARDPRRRGGSGGRGDRVAVPEVAPEGGRAGDADPLSAKVDAGHIALFLGAKRSGKSTLATAIAGRFDRVYAQVPREEDQLPGSRVCRSDEEVGQAVREGVHRITYLARRDELRRLREIIDGHLELLLATGMAWCVLIHEGGDVADEHDTLPAMSEIIRQGSAKGWVVLWIYQRAYELPRILTNNVDHVFLFAMNDPDELRRAGALMGSTVVRERPLALPLRYDFYQRGPQGQLLYVDQQRRVARLVLPARTMSV